MNNRCTQTATHANFAVILTTIVNDASMTSDALSALVTPLLFMTSTIHDTMEDVPVNVGLADFKFTCHWHPLEVFDSTTNGITLSLSSRRRSLLTAEALRRVTIDRNSAATPSPAPAGHWVHPRLEHFNPACTSRGSVLQPNNSTHACVHLLH
jgi:hypothetical protein